jgi:predicted Rossmann-fold nucleotide-binding protein
VIESGERGSDWLITRLRSRAGARVARMQGAHVRRILVAGIGAREIPMPIVWASGILGRELGRAGYGLLTGGWPGVDHLVSREYVLQLRRDGLKGDAGLLHVLPQDGTPDLWEVPEMQGEGTIDARGSERETSRRSVELADAVVVLGGLGGTQEIARLAARMGRPVLGVPGLGGVSDEFLQWVPRRSERREPGPIQSPADARRAVLDLIDHLPSPLDEAM